MNYLDHTDKTCGLIAAIVFFIEKLVSSSYFHFTKDCIKSTIIAIVCATAVHLWRKYVLKDKNKKDEN